jgi:predicted secreted protein
MKGDKTKLLRGDGETPEVFTEVAEILEVGDITINRETYDDTTFDSPEGYEELGGGKKKVDPIDLKVKYNKGAAIAALLRGDIDSDEAVNYQIHWPDTPQTKKQIAAFVTKITMSTPQHESVTETFTFAPSGKIIDVV